MDSTTKFQIRPKIGQKAIGNVGLMVPIWPTWELEPLQHAGKKKTFLFSKTNLKSNLFKLLVRITAPKLSILRKLRC